MKGLVIGTLLLAIIAVGLISAKPSPKAASKKVVCYYGSWAVYRPGDGKFDVSNIDPFVCTHLIYGFAGLGSDNKLKILDEYNDLEENWGKGAMKRFTALKNINPELRVSLAVGGWNEGSEKYSAMVANAASRRTFIDSVIEFLPTQNFDGFDLDWEYPAAREGKPEDKENFVKLVQELREEFDKRGWLLTAAVSAGEPTILDAYDVPTLARLLDAIHIMAYDFHGAFESFTHHHAPMFAHPKDTENNFANFNVDYAVRLWHDLGAPFDKLVLGIGTYGRGFTLSDASNTGLYAPASQPSPAGPYTREAGILGYNEICVDHAQQQWQVTRDAAIQAPIAVRDRVWVGYEDVESVSVKAAYARDMGLAGVMTWSIETDDFHGSCGGGTFPLVTAMYTVVNGAPIPTQPTTPSTTSTTRDPAAPTTTTTATTTTTTRAPPTGSPDVHCKQEGANADPDSCQIFYECHWNGQSWDMAQKACGAGTAFNPANGICDFPFNVPGCA